MRSINKYLKLIFKKMLVLVLLLPFYFEYRGMGMGMFVIQQAHSDMSVLVFSAAVANNPRLDGFSHCSKRSEV